jgi:hypothetical protein
MTESLRSALRWSQIRTGAGVLLALAVAAFVVIPAVGLILALLALIGLLIAQAARRKGDAPR